jgi:glucose/arabinose dehydrogenase
MHQARLLSMATTRALLAALLLAACGAGQSASTVQGAPATSVATPAAAAQPAATQPAAAPSATAKTEVRGVRTGPRAMAATTLQVPPSLRRGTFAQDRQVQIQEGFAISLFALVSGARSMALAPWGDLLVTQPSQGRIVALGDADGDGVAEAQRPLAQGLQCPYGMAFRDGYLYVAESTKVERFPYNNGAELGPPQVVVDGLPQSGCAPHHYRPLTFDPAGYFYVGFGSSCNVCVESDTRRGTVWQFTPDGGGQQFASGLRNTVDLEVNPATGELWGAVNERDELGDDVPPDPIATITGGANYGWPYCYLDGSRWRVDTRVPARNPSCSGLATYFGIQAHSAPLGLAFYAQSQFPPDFGGSLFVALHGSWNRSNATGYKVIQIPFANGQPQPPEDFATGWLLSARGAANTWGRPVDVQPGADGALYVSDDQAGAVYRITYGGG